MNLNSLCRTPTQDTWSQISTRTCWPKLSSLRRQRKGNAEHEPRGTFYVPIAAVIPWPPPSFLCQCFPLHETPATRQPLTCTGHRSSRWGGRTSQRLQEGRSQLLSPLQCLKLWSVTSDPPCQCLSLPSEHQRSFMTSVFLSTSCSASTTNTVVFSKKLADWFYCFYWSPCCIQPNPDILNTIMSSFIWIYSQTQ